MGACFNTFRVSILQAPTSSKLKDVYLREKEAAQYEEGHGGYTGTIAESQGFKVVNKTFDTESAAENYLDEKCEKWGPTLAVKVKNETEEFWLLGGCYSS